MYVFQQMEKIIKISTRKFELQKCSDWLIKKYISFEKFLKEVEEHLISDWTEMWPVCGPA